MMARCAGSSLCNCVIHAGSGVGVSGAGTPQNPYIVENIQSFNLAVRDTPTVDLSLAGTGGDLDPYLLTADATLAMHDLTDVSPVPPANGQVLAWNGSQWVPVPPATAAPGLINTTGCLEGDGSTTAPLGIAIAPNSGLACAGDGLTLATDPLTRIRWHRQANLSANQYIDIGLLPDNPYFSSVIPSGGGQVLYTALQTCLASFLLTGSSTSTVNPGNANLRAQYGVRDMTEEVESIGGNLWRTQLGWTTLITQGEMIVAQFRAGGTNLLIDFYSEITVQPVVRTPNLIGS